jgi:hypothetical protein
VVGEVAVRVDAVADLGLSVSVAVPEVLPPQPLVIERVLVAVGVGHEDEPEFGRLQKLADGAIVGPPPSMYWFISRRLTSVEIHSRACWVEL